MASPSPLPDLFRRGAASCSKGRNIRFWKALLMPIPLSETMKRTVSCRPVRRNDSTRRVTFPFSSTNLRALDKKVHQYLLEPHGIADIHPSDAGIDGRFENNALGCGAAGGEQRHIVNDPSKIKWF